MGLFCLLHFSSPFKLPRNLVRHPQGIVLPHGLSSISQGVCWVPAGGPESGPPLGLPYTWSPDGAVACFPISPNRRCILAQVESVAATSGRADRTLSISVALVTAWAQAVRNDILPGCPRIHPGLLMLKFSARIYRHRSLDSAGWPRAVRSP